MGLISKLSFSKKLIMTFLLVGLLLPAISLLTFIILEKINGDFKFLSSNHSKKIEYLTTTQNYLQEAAQSAMLTIGYTDYESKIGDLKADFQQNMTRYDELNQKITAIESKPDEDEVFKKIAAQVELIKQKGNTVFEKAKNVKTAEQKNNLLMYVNDEFDSARVELNQSFNQIINLEYDYLNKGFGKSIDSANFYTKLSLLIGALGYLAIVGISVMYSKSVTKQIKNLVEEISNPVKDNLVASEELSNVSSSLTETSNTSASEIEKTAAAVEELSSIVKTNTDHTGESVQIASNVLHKVELSKGKIQALSETVSKINKSSDEINEITKSIDDIAFQINLLALNAAVEAARAGDHGKGFAVVADAVRNLAQKSATSAKSADQIISSSRQAMGEGEKLAKEANSAFEEILKSVDSLSEKIKSIAQASSEQSSSVQQISHTMNNLDGVVQENAASAVEVSKDAEHLKQSSEKIDQLVVTLKNYFGV